MKGLGFLFAFFFFSTAAFAIDQSVGLKGITTVNVMVADLSDDPVKDGVEKETLTATLELALRMAGLTVLTQGQYDDTVPTIILRVSAIKEPNRRFYATDIILACLDNLSNPRTTRMFSAEIWSNDLLQLLGIVNLSRVVEGEKKLINLFLDDYSKANPK